MYTKVIEPNGVFLLFLQEADRKLSRDRKDVKKGAIYTSDD
jgi:hypothetical protein